MKIQLVREDEVRESVFSSDTPLDEVMADVHNSHVGRNLKPVTEVRRVDCNGQVVESLPAWKWRAQRDA